MKTTKMLILQPSSPTCYIVSFRPKYFPQFPVPKEPESCRKQAFAVGILRSKS